MKVSELWLREFVNFNKTVEEIVKQIDTLGLEVNNISPLMEKKIFWEKKIIGNIIKCAPHATLNRYFLTKVDIGEKHPIEIVSNCQDFHINLRVVVSVKKKYYKEKLKKKISSEKKNYYFSGNFCSFKDLGIVYNKKESSKIIQLPINAPIGCNICSYLRLNDNIIDISVHSNRMDCFSILGISREIAAFNRINLRFPKIKPINPTITDQVSFRIQSEQDCPNYFARIIKNINVNIQTPIWIKEKLRRCGIYSKNILTDISNYILLKFGQPIYIFDLERINGDIIIRRSNPNEIFYLSGKKIILEPNTLVIADSKKILAIAGVIDESLYLNVFSPNILLGCIFFTPSSITGNAKHYNMVTSFSRIYEYGIDYNIQLQVIEYTTSLFINLCKSTQPGPISHMKSKFLIPKVIFFSQKNLVRLIGNFISDKETIKILNYLGFKIFNTENGWKITVPSWRFDIFLEEDIIEEIIRIYGYEKIPKTPICPYFHTYKDNYKKFPFHSLSKIKHFLVDRGYQEVITYSFVDPSIQKLLYPSRTAKEIINPISKEMSVMRLSLWVGLIKSFVYNQNRQAERIRLFESGSCFEFLGKNSKIRQKFLLSGLISGSRFNEHWNLINKETDFYDLKGDLESIFYIINVFDDIKFRNNFHPSLHPGQSAFIFLKNTKIGYLGAINPTLKKKLGIKNSIFLFELFLDDLFSYQEQTREIFDISCFPINKRDLTFHVKNEIAISDILSECQNLSTKICPNTTTIKINLFDIYQGIKVEKGYKSFSIRIYIQDISKTLEEKEISDITKKLIDQLSKKFQTFLSNKS